jgi:hypothetical protein
LPAERAEFMNLWIRYVRHSVISKNSNRTATTQRFYRKPVASEAKGDSDAYGNVGEKCKPKT